MKNKDGVFVDYFNEKSLDSIATLAKFNPAKVSAKEKEKIKQAQVILQYWRLFVTSLEVTEDVLENNNFFIETAEKAFNLMPNNVKVDALEWALDLAIKTDNLFLIQKINKMSPLANGICSMLRAKLMYTEDAFDESKVCYAAHCGSLRVLSFLVNLNLKSEDVNAFFSDSIINCLKEVDFKDCPNKLNSLIINKHPYFSLLSLDHIKTDQVEIYNNLLKKFQIKPKLKADHPLSKSMCFMAAHGNANFLDAIKMLELHAEENEIKAAAYELLLTQEKQARIDNGDLKYYSKDEVAAVKKRFNNILNFFSYTNANLSNTIMDVLIDKIDTNDLLGKIIYTSNINNEYIKAEISALTALLKDFPNTKAAKLVKVEPDQDKLKELVDKLSLSIVEIENHTQVTLNGVKIVHELIETLNSLRTVKTAPSLRL